MTAATLFAILAKLTPDERNATRVVLATDAEGNGFAPLAEAHRDHGRNVELTHVTKTMRETVSRGAVLVLWPM